MYFLWGFYLYQCMDFYYNSSFFRTIIFKRLYLEAQMELNNILQLYTDAQRPNLSIYQVSRTIRQLYNRFSAELLFYCKYETSSILT